MYCLNFLASALYSLVGGQLATDLLEEVKRENNKAKIDDVSMLLS